MTRFWRTLGVGVLAVCILFSNPLPSFAETDITSQIKVRKILSWYSWRRKTRTDIVILRNKSQNTFATPIKAVIEDISHPSVEVLNADGITADGKPYFECTTWSGKLKPRRFTRIERWKFSNPKRKRFRYKVRVYGDIYGEPNAPTVDIQANPAEIEQGQTSALSWTSTDADTCEIDQGVGAVDCNDTLEVSPTETTTYTITAQGSGGTATDDVTVTVTIPPPLPTVNIDVEPTDIIEGEGAMLTWTSTDADVCEINQGIGVVTCNDTLAISPLESKTYTITATGPGGTATAGVSISVSPPPEPPTVQINVNPDSIIEGESASLSWTSTNADACEVDQGIGIVACNDTVSISPLESRTFTITATGPGGTAAASVSISVNPPPEPPTVVLSVDPDTIFGGESASLSWTSTDADTCEIDQGIGVVACNDTLDVSPTETTTYTIDVSGPGGTTADSVTVTVTPAFLTTVEIDAASETIPLGDSTDLSWTSNNATHLSIDNGIGSVDTSGALIVTPEHTTIYTITATGPNGSASAKVMVSVTATPTPPPEGSFGEEYEDIIPLDATIDEYDPERVAIVTGKVNDIVGLPVADVLISIQNHLEYGTTKTDVDGQYSLPVEGGGTLNVIFQKEGLLTAHRKVQVPWNDIAIVETIAMIAVDTKDTTFTFDGNASTIATHQSTEVNDEFGSRTSTTVFTGDNKAYAVDENGNDLFELTTITTRATEYTTPESMPAVLPPASAFTYCVELGVDGVETVRFEKPIINWVDNFLGFDVGETVPAGYYDRGQGIWVAYDNGVVVRLLDTDTDGIVDALDADGDGVADDLNEDGSYTDEVLGLSDSSQYSPGDTYWRIILQHFTPLDYNWPFTAPASAIDPNATTNPHVDKQPSSIAKGNPGFCPINVGSFVTARNRIFHEDIPITGTGLTLHYSGNRVDGYQTVITVPASGDTVPVSLKNIIVKLEIAGKTFEQTLAPLPNQKAEFIWDGMSFLGREVDIATAHIKVGFLYEAVYVGFGAGPFTTPTFGLEGTEITGIRARQELTSWQSYDVSIQNPSKLSTLLADGWSLSNHHGAKADVLHKGDGTVVSDAISSGVYGLIAYYSFDGNANDQSGYGNDAIAHGPVLTEDRFGQTDSAYSFDGIDDYLDIGPNIKPELPITFSMWIYIEEYPAQFSGLIVLDDLSYIYYGATMGISSDGRIWLRVGSGVFASEYTRRSKIGQSSIPLNTWTHVVGVIRGIVDMDIYIDGINDGGTYSGKGGEMVYSDNPGKIGYVTGYGRYGNNVPHSFNGKIDNVRVYDRDLSQEDVQQLGTSQSQELTFGEEGVGYIISDTGQHKQTIDLDTGKVVEEFLYDAQDRLVSVNDHLGNQVTVERNASGVPTAIVSPDGIRTELVIDANNHLTKIRYPDGTSYDFEYTPDGLMTKETEPNGNVFTHVFDANGRVTDIMDEEGGHHTFSRQTFANGDIETTIETAAGNVTTYLDHTDFSGAYTSTISGATCGSSCAVTDYSRSADAMTAQKTHPDGTVRDFQYDVDPEHKFKYLRATTVTTPSGLTAQTQTGRAYQDTNADDIKDRITETVTVNGKTSTAVHDTLAAQVALTSPEGRTITSQYDPNTLLTSAVSVPGLLDTTYGYDTKGRVTNITTGTRQTVFSYDTQGNVQSIKDPKNNLTTFDYDALGRTTAIHRPDSTDIAFSYDANGNMTVLTNPSTIDHDFNFNKVNLMDDYQAPLSGSYQYTYDKDRRLTQTMFPSGDKITNIYTGTLLTQVQTPEGNIDLIYLPSEQVDIITKGMESVDYDYDGALVTSKTLAGTLNQTLSFVYNNDFDLTAFTYAGVTSNFAYDNDGLLTTAGGFTLTNNAQNGLPEGLTDGVMNLSRTFNNYGEVATQSATINTADVNSWTLTYNDNGQIETKSETVAGTTSNYTYEYDATGRLTKVYKDSAVVEEYGYTNGIRSLETNTLRGISGKTYNYNDEDQLLTAGSTTYQYDTDGFLWTKVEGANSTTYDYSSRGELLSVALPDGRTIEYVHDPLGRRIAKKINGMVVEKYLWRGLTQLLAVYDGSDNLLMRFEYAGALVPYSMAKDGSTYYLTYDQVGSLRAVSDASGAVVKHVDYDTFGNIISDSDTSFEVPFGFAGGMHDRDTGLVRFGFRDYDPMTGRWTAKDPIGFAGGDVDLYGYVLNNPVNLIDPTGQSGILGLGVPIVIETLKWVSVAVTTYVTYRVQQYLAKRVGPWGAPQHKVIIRYGVDPTNFSSMYPGGPNFYKNILFVAGGIAIIGNTVTDFMELLKSRLFKDPLTEHMYKHIKDGPKPCDGKFSLPVHSDRA